MNTTAALQVLLIFVVLVMLFSVPVWPHSRDWGFYPSTFSVVVAVLLLILVLRGV